MIEASFTLDRGRFSLEIDLALPLRGIVGLCGASGSGKSTVFNVLAGHVRPGSGHVRLFGRTLFHDRLRIDVAPAERRIGVVFQDALLFPHMTVRRNLLYGAGPGTEALFDEIVDALELAPLLARRPRRLSGGERQRVAIGRALMAQPGLLLLDEPVSALDPALRARTLDLLQAVQRRTGQPMIYISHAPEEMRRICGPIVTMAKGRVVDISDRPAPVPAPMPAPAPEPAPAPQPAPAPAPVARAV